MDTMDVMLPRRDGDALVGAPAGVTMAALAARSGASVRTIKQWHRDGLLPAPTREPDEPRRGRPPYRFPVVAIPVAQRLAVFRKYVTGPDNTKVWLFLEGFPHLSHAEAPLEARLRAWHAALWRCAAHRLRLVAPFRSGTTEGRADDILDALDLTVRQPLSARFPAPITEAGVGMAALMLGVADGEDVQAWCRAVQESGAEGRRLVGFVETTLRLLGRIAGMPWPGGLVLSEDDERLLASRLSVFLPRLRWFPANLNWERIRFAWRAICAVTDPWLAAPTTAPDPWIALACEWRRLCYRAAPEATLLTLAAITDQRIRRALGLEEAGMRSDVADGGSRVRIAAR